MTSPDAVSYLGHAPSRIHPGGAPLLTDPGFCNHLAHLRPLSAPIPPAAYERPDGILLSHLHRDHLDLPSLRRLPSGVPVLVPRGGGPLLREHGFTRVEEVQAGDTVQLAGADVTAVPAEHSGRR